MHSILANLLIHHLDSEDRDDMNGTGSFDRENVSLYVSRIATYDDPEVGDPFFSWNIPLSHRV